MNGKRKSESVAAAAVSHKQFMRYIENKKYRRRRREREREREKEGREREKSRGRRRGRRREREGEGEKDGLIDSIGIGR